MVNTISKELALSIINGGFISCKDIHNDSCEWHAIEKFYLVAKNGLKVYIPVHLIPAIIFKRKKFKTEPWQVIKSVAKNVFWSVIMIATYVTVFRYLTCFLKNKRQKIDRLNVIIPGFVCAFSILFEPSHRRAELCLYLVPRFIEALWNFLEKRGVVKSFKNGEAVIFALTMSTLMYCYQNEQQSIKPTYMNIFKVLWGEN